MGHIATQTLEFLETSPIQSLSYCFYFYGAMSTLHFYSSAKSKYRRWSFQIRRGGKGALRVQVTCGPVTRLCCPKQRHYWCPDGFELITESSTRLGGSHSMIR